jgi:hypothetical protein
MKEILNRASADHKVSVKAAAFNLLDYRLGKDGPSIRPISEHCLGSGETSLPDVGS